MLFFSGFSLKDETDFFKEYIKNTDYCVCGFSYGAIKAFKEVGKMLKKQQRVDTLQLFSPAFFQTKKESFKKLQLRAYKKNKTAYLQNFIESCSNPHPVKKVQRNDTTENELKELLFYTWDFNELLKLKNKGIEIEVYLGEKDKIIDVNKAHSFFTDVADVTFIKEANHFLQTK